MQQAPDSIARLCAGSFGGTVRLRAAEQIVAPDWGRSTVWRCWLDREATGGSAPASLIAKLSNLGGGHGRNEAACLRFLARYEELAGHVPRLYGFDAEAGLLLLEDFGELRGQRLSDILAGGDSELARAALLAAAALFGRLGALSCGQLPAWRRIAWDAIDSPLDTTGHAAWRLVPLLQALPAVFTHHELQLDAAARAELRRVEQELSEPGGFLCFSHGDFCPGNLAYVEGRIRLYDFEMGSFRHALVDGSYMGLRHLRCVDGASLPDALAAEMDTLYRSELIRGCPAAGDDESYYFARTCCCCAWLAAMLEWLPALEREDRVRGASSDRRRILSGLAAFSRRAAGPECLPQLATSMGALHDRLAALWPEALAPAQFPAFSLEQPG